MTVTILGTGFAPEVMVRVESTATTSVTIISGTKLSAVTPAHASALAADRWFESGRGYGLMPIDFGTPPRRGAAPDINRV